MVRKAYEAQQFAYTPYSHWQVGAALLGKSGKIYLGCNIENAAYSPTNCGERTAFFKAISEGEKEFEAIAIVGNKEGQEGGGEYCPPCGVCRQVMMEFCNPQEFKIILGNGLDDYKVVTLKEMLPMGFGGNEIENV
ncbi:MAG: cytidine deaminase [Lachnospiraceae bacterium]